MKKVFMRSMVKGKRGGNLSIVINGQEVVQGVHKNKPKNPRSQAQMGQRVQLTNILGCYQLLRPFLKEAYEKKPDGLNYYNLFIKNNLGKVKAYLSKKEAAVKACVVAPYQISEGTLPAVGMRAQGKGLVSSIRLPKSFRMTEEMTVGKVSKAILSANRAMHKGDKLSIIHLAQSVYPDDGMPYVRQCLYEFELNPASGEVFHEQMPPSLFDAVNGYAGTGEGLETGGVAYVWSRRKGDKVCVSTQSIVLTPDNELYELYASEDKRQSAAESYGAISEERFLKPKVSESKGNERAERVSTPLKKVGIPRAATNEPRRHQGYKRVLEGVRRMVGIVAMVLATGGWGET
ncbi:hypothetical protein EZS27_019077 [termite gut metagenome]|uniref:Uncharacterized protein n=1 Tax=termite gut metagenome TaxID=433724 RepID=A0A5J4RH99_9ZZZZ